jgi:hypothetical protein
VERAAKATLLRLVGTEARILVNLLVVVAETLTTEQRRVRVLNLNGIRLLRY